jgi:hypothetical protein
MLYKERNKMLRKFLRIAGAGLLGIAVLAAAAALYLWYNSTENKLARYFDDKYGIEVEVVSEEGWNMGNMGDLTHEVAVKGNKNIKFDVFVNDGKVTGDTYPRGLDVYEQYKKLKPFLPEIKEAGFQAPLYGNYVEYLREAAGVYNISFSRKGELDYHTFKKEEFNHLYKLLQLLKKTGIPVRALDVSYTETKRKNGITESITLRLEDLAEMDSEAWLWEKLREDHHFKNAYLSDGLIKEAEKIENGRFRFDSVYEDNWLECGQAFSHGGGECHPYTAYVSYKKQRFHQDDPMLPEDLETVRRFLAESLPKDSRFNIVVMGVRSVKHPENDWSLGPYEIPELKIEHADWERYESTRDMLKAKFEEAKAEK